MAADSEVLRLFVKDLFDPGVYLVSKWSGYPNLNKICNAHIDFIKTMGIKVFHPAESKSLRLSSPAHSRSIQVYTNDTVNVI